jgi:hypothetical protein
MGDFSAKDRERLIKLCRLMGSDNANEREQARKKISELLNRRKKSWNDFVDLIQGSSSARQEQHDQPSDRNDHGGRSGQTVNPIDLVLDILERYMDVPAHQLLAVALWILHTHVCDRFMVSPRLILTSPVRGCGKTTLLEIIERLAVRGVRADSITAAAIYHMIDYEHPTLLLDEADNLDAEANKLLKAVLNGGHRKGAARVHVVEGRPRRFSMFGAMALATIGSLPLPLMHRSIVIELKRTSRTDLSRFDVNDAAALFDLNTIYGKILGWSGRVVLDDPSIPIGLRNRPADNWRPLMAIADACGYGDAAREAAIALSADRPDEDPTVVLLQDIRDLFNRRRDDRLTSSELVDDLCALEDGCWGEWRGIRDDQQPRRLTQGELARLLAPFRIRPRTIWPTQRRSDAKSAKGYYRYQFEAAWAAYCQSDVTPSHRSNIRYLR